MFPSETAYAGAWATPRKAMQGGKLLEKILLFLAFLLLASHWIHPSADPSVMLTWSGYVDRSNDYFTDEGFDCNNAILAVMHGHWYKQGEFNNAVDAPLWPLLLFLPFKIFGVSIVVARLVTTSLYFASVGMTYLFVKRWSDGVSGALVTIILASNFVAMQFSRLAVPEAVWLFLVIAALLTAQHAEKDGSLRLSFASGLLAAAAVTTKMTAAFAIVPLLGVLWIRIGKSREFVRSACAAIAGYLFPILAYRFLLVHRYPADHEVYVGMNISVRRVTTVGQWIMQWVHLALGIHMLDRLLWLACGAVLLIVAGVLIFRLRPARSINPLIWIASTWLVLNMAALSFVTYFPVRYCFSLIVPVAIVTVIGVRIIFEIWPRAAVLLYAMIACSCLINVAESIWYEAHPEYSYEAMASSIKRHVQSDGVTHPQIMGAIAATLALYSEIPPLGDQLGTIPRADRIARFDPAYYISQQPVLEPVTEAFAKSGRHLVLVERYNVLHNYMTHQPVYFYRVEKADLR